MTLSSQLGASLGTSAVAASQGQPTAARARRPSSVGGAAAFDHHDGLRRGTQDDSGGRFRSKLSALFRSTGNLGSLGREILDETAAGLLRTVTRASQKKRKKKLSSQWTHYAGPSLDEEAAAADEDAVSVFGDAGSSGAPSRAGSTASLADDRAPLRRTLSFVESGGPAAVVLRPRSGSHAGHDAREFRRSMGSIPVEYSDGVPGPSAAPGGMRQHERRHSRSREHMHSLWSTSLTSLQEGVIADDPDPPGCLRRSHDSVLGRVPHDGVLDEVDGAASPARSPAGSIGAAARVPGRHAAGCAHCRGSLPTIPHRLQQEASVGIGSSFLQRSLSSAGEQPRTCVCGGGGGRRHRLDEDPTRSRSLTHIAAALDMSGDPLGDALGDPGRPDRLVVPAAGEACHSLRRQKLTSRSQLSSSEYFLVTFEVSAADGPHQDVPDEEYVVAAKGTTLQEALSGPCQKRGLSLGGVSVFLDGSKLDIATSLHSESSVLAGKQLRIRAKQDGKAVKGVLSRAATSQQPTLRKTSSSVRNNRRFFSTSTEEPGVTGSPAAPEFLGLEGLAKAKGSKQRWSIFSGNNKDTKIEALTDQLDTYTKHGIPGVTAPEADERLYQVEENWRELVAGAEALPERLQQQQDAIWELLQTEVAFIRIMTVVKDLFLACLSSLHEARILTDVDKGRLFSNIVDIHAANAHFWEQYLAPLVAATRESRQPLNPYLLLDGFDKFDEIFKPYVQYCAEQAECQKYCREQMSEGELFTIYLVWCETQSPCNRLRLVDILVKPMLRLTKYSLLLKAILKKTDCEEQRRGLDFMIRKVDEFVVNVNSKCRERHEHDRLKAIIDRMDTYDVVESKDEDLEKMIKIHNDLDLTRPMPDCPPSQRRYLLYEGDLRLRDLNNSKVDVHCVLLTDMLLVCKTTTKKTEHRTARVRVLRPPYLVARLVVQELPRDPPTLAVVYLNEYKVATTAFLLSSPEAKLVKTWAEMIRKAQGLYAEAKLAAASSPSVPPPSQYHGPPLSLSRQPSSLCDEDAMHQHDEVECDTHSYTSYSLGLYPHRSPRGSTRGSSLNHSHSGSVEMNEASSLSSVSHSRGISVDNNELRASSLSSDEGIPPIGADQAAAGGAEGVAGGRGGRSLRRSAHSKSPSPNTLSIQVPVFSSLGQSLPNLNLAASSPHGCLPQPPSSLLLVPPSGKGSLHQHHGPLSPGHRGTSYPPPSPPRGSLHRGLALAASRNPPLMKMRHVSSVAVPSQQSCTGPAPSWTGPAGAAGSAAGSAGAPHSPTASQAPSTFDFDVPVIAGVSPPRDEQQQGTAGGGGGGAGSGPPAPSPRQSFMMKRLTRTDNRRYHTAGTIDDVKKAECRDASIHKRLSWNYGPQSCGSRRQSHWEDSAATGHPGGHPGGHQDVLLIDRATSPLEPPPHVTSAAWSHVHAPSTERTEPVTFQSPSVGSSPSVSPGAGPAAAHGAAAAVSVTSSPARSTSSPIQLPSLNTSPTFGCSAGSAGSSGPELAPSNPFLEDVVGQDEAFSGDQPLAAAPDEVLVLITDAQSDHTEA